jgi:hypothetical protein
MSGKKLFRVLFAFILMFQATGCGIEINRRHTDKAVAQVGIKFLYESELKQELPGGMEPSDSLIFVQDYINSWIKQQLLIQEVERRLPLDEKNVSRETEKYRQELLIHKYKNHRIDEVVENLIPYSEIEKYYYDNLEKFKLHRIIVRVSYSILPQKVDPPHRIRQLLTSNDADDQGEVDEYMYQYAKRYDNFNDNWIYFDNIVERIDYPIEEEIPFLRRNKLIEFEKEKELHLIAIKQYLLPGAQAPLDFVAPRIRSMIINQRKLDFLREIKDSLYEEALKYNKFRLFN